MPDLKLLIFDVLLHVINAVALFLPMLSALIVVAPVVAVILWQTRER
jgi:hypothetical protein